MRLIVGLGNPGREYVGTRHNVGFEVLDQFAARLGWIGSPDQFQTMAKSKFDGLTLDGSVSLHSTGQLEKVLLLKPMTFMNVSGKSVRFAMDFFGLAPQDVLVVLDDIALPCGRIRLRGAGSSGGHNGLKDIERVLGTNEYSRLRIGIDAPGRVPQRDYVLGRFNPDQRKKTDDAIARACGAIITWIDQGLNKAMSLFNGEES
jgi:PTH1 family peptidyl-tRNA hydrolase